MSRRHLNISLAFLAFGALATAAAPEDMMKVPFTDPLSAPSLDAGWKIDVSPGNSIAVKDGALTITAKENTYAHIQRPLGADFVRAGCEIKGGPGITWCTSIFLYWDTENWCQFGVIPRDGARFYVLEMIDGRPHEYELEGCPTAEWQPIYIRLGVDSILYYGRLGRRASHVFVANPQSIVDPKRIARRPEQFSGPPKLLVVGKGHGGPPGYPKPDLNNDYTQPGEVGTSAVRNVFVSPLKWEDLQQRPSLRAALEKDYHDVIGEQELAAAGDPTFESVARHLPAQKHPREIVGVKDHPHDIGVAEDGTLQLNDNITDPKLPVAYFEVGPPKGALQRFGTGKTRCRKHLLNGWMPIVVAEWEHVGLKYEQTVFGWTEGLSSDTPVAAYVRMKVSNLAAEARTGKLLLKVAPPELKIAGKQWDLDVPANEDRSIYVAVPFDIAKTPVGDVAADEFERKLAEVTAYWQKLIAAGTRFEIPERRVQDAYRAWLAYNFLNVDKRDGVYHVCDGAGFYEQIYGYSMALYCHALDLMGYHEQARTYLASLMTFIQPDGLLCVNFGATDTGVLLYVLSEHYRLTGDAEWLRPLAPRMVTMCNWIIEHRKESMKHMHGKRAMVYGLVRWRPYCDFELPAFDYFCNGYLCVGMESAAAALADLGLTADADRLKREAAAFRKDIQISMDAAVITRDGFKMLPIMPDTQALLKESNFTANGYYGLLASCLLESGVLTGDERRGGWLVDMLERRGGLVLGVCQWFGQIDHAYAYGYWMDRLRHDEVKKVILGLYGSLAYGMTRETYSPVECHRVRTGENWHTEPHTYSSTAQLHLLRNMLVREDGQDLLIGQAIPRPWLAAGQRVAINAAPTKFGPVSASIESHADQGFITVKLDPPSRAAPATIKLRLRHPDALKIKSVDTNPTLPVKITDETIEFGNLKERVEVTARY